MNFEIKKLPDICTIKTGKHDANHAVSNGRYRFYTCASQYNYCDTVSFSGECVIVPGNGDIGLVFYYNGDFDAYQRTYVLTDIKINAKYLYYHMCLMWRKTNDMKKFGSTVKYVRMSNFTSYTIPIPSIGEQERIVARIEELFSELDNGVETLKKTKEQLAVYRQAVLNHEFSACGSEVPLKSVCKHITDGDHMPPPKSPSGIPFIMISNIYNHKINWTNTSFVGREYFDNIDTKRKPQKDDVLYTVTGSFGIPVLVNFDKEFCFQRHIALLRPDSSILPKYLFYVLQTSRVYNQASEKSTGTAQKTVALSVLREMTIPYIEDKGIQDKIVTSVQNKLSVCDSIEHTVNDALQQAVAMRQSILKKAFEGGLI